MNIERAKVILGKEFSLTADFANEIIQVMFHRNVRIFAPPEYFSPARMICMLKPGICINLFASK